MKKASLTDGCIALFALKTLFMVLGVEGHEILFHYLLLAMETSGHMQFAHALLAVLLVFVNVEHHPSHLDACRLVIHPLNRENSRNTYRIQRNQACHRRPPAPWPSVGRREVQGPPPQAGQALGPRPAVESPAELGSRPQPAGELLPRFHLP